MKRKKIYEVTVPYAGTAVIEVAAHSAAEAIDAAFDVDITGIGDERLSVIDFEIYKRACRGNVCCLSMNEAVAEDTGEIDESEYDDE